MMQAELAKHKKLFNPEFSFEDIATPEKPNAKKKKVKEEDSDDEKAAGKKSKKLKAETELIDEPTETFVDEAVLNKKDHVRVKTTSIKVRPSQ